MTCQVIRPFEGDGGKMLQPGEVVDTTGWLWTERLIDQGYLRVVAFAPAIAPSAKSRKD